MEKRVEEKTIKRLKIHFYAHVAVVLVFFLLVFFKAFSFLENPESVSVALELYAIIFTLIAIPSALKLFAHKIKKIQKGNQNSVIKAYKNIYFLRLYIIGFTTFINTVLFAVSRNNNFMWMAVISFVIYAFCNPSYNELFSLTEIENKEQNQN